MPPELDAPGLGAGVGAGGAGGHSLLYGRPVTAAFAGMYVVKALFVRLMSILGNRQNLPKTAQLLEANELRPVRRG